MSWLKHKASAAKSLSATTASTSPLQAAYGRPSTVMNPIWIDTEVAARNTKTIASVGPQSEQKIEPW